MRSFRRPWHCFPLLVALAFAGCASEPPAANAQPESSPLETEEQQVLYALGLVMSQNLAALGLSEEELAVVQEGLLDGVLGHEAKVDVEEVGPKIQNFAQSRVQAAAEQEKEASVAFLDEMAAELGAERLESGLIYTEISAGDGPTPKATDRVRVNYHGTLRDGTVFDSSVDRGEPIEFGLDQVIACWTEGLQQMRVGGRAKLVCPAEIAYGDQPRPPKIPGGATLVFEVELLDITTPPG